MRLNSATADYAPAACGVKFTSHDWWDMQGKSMSYYNAEPISKPAGNTKSESLKRELWMYS